MNTKTEQNKMLSFTQEASELIPSAWGALAEQKKKGNRDKTKSLAKLYIFFHTVGKSASYFGLNNISSLGTTSVEFLSLVLTGEIPKFLPKHKKELSQAITLIEEALNLINQEYSDDQIKGSAQGIVEKIDQFCGTMKKKEKKKYPEEDKHTEPANDTVKIRNNFVQEAAGILAEIGEKLELFKKNPDDRTIALSLLQKTRVLRGSCGVYGFLSLEKLNQQIENLLEKVESGENFNMDELIDVLLILKDVNQDTVTAISSGEQGDIYDLASYLGAIDDIKPVEPSRVTEPHVERDLPKQKESAVSPPREEVLTEKKETPRPSSDPAPEEQPQEKPPEDEARMALSPELIESFVQETDDMLPEMEQNLLSWAETPDDLELVGNLFRRIHSLKGNCGFYGFKDLEKLSHQMETILSAAKSGISLDTGPLVNTLLKMKDVIADTVNAISSGETDSISGLGALLTELQEYSPDNPPRESENGATPSPNAGTMPDFTFSPELMSMFINETEELLQDMEQHLISWESEPKNTEIISNLFRRIHSLKGNCGFYGFGDLEKLSHSMETLLDAAKSGVTLEIKNLVQTLLRLKDVIGEAVSDISTGGQGNIADLPIYIGLLEKILPKGWQSGEEEKEKSGKIGHILVDQGVITNKDIEKVITEQNKPFGEKLVDLGIATPGEVESALKKQKSEEANKKGFSATHSKGKEIAKRQNIRVDLEKLDTLINLIGEMAIAENMITNNPEIIPLQLESFKKAAQHMNKIVRELQEMAMTIRMVPVSGLFRRMIRLVHDLSNKCGKKVDFKLLGEETEVDKTVVEVITDPLVHIIRNSLDHGLESPEERAALKKPLTGTLKLSASHEEGQVRITVSDDGRGLNKEKILAKAKENGLIDDDGANMTNHQVFSLIFNPGFSTADRITDVSGRGVGMDVVKKNLDTVKGRVSVKSKPTKGTSISLRIPLTLAIIDGMVVKIKDLKYVIPVLSIKESFVPTLDAITETPDGSYVVRVRDNFYPVIRFDDLFEEHSEGTAKPLTEGVLVVLENQDSNVCLYVDQLIGQQQIVIKALSTYIDKVRGVSGCTILGDGEICLIVDVGSLVDSVEQKGIESQ